jgi:hypothetical protein
MLRSDLRKLNNAEVMEKYQFKMSNKPWFDKQCSKLFDKRKQAKLLWLHNPSQTNRANVDNARCEASTTFMTIKGISVR